MIGLPTRADIAKAQIHMRGEAVSEKPIGESKGGAKAGKWGFSTIHLRRSSKKNNK